MVKMRHTKPYRGKIRSSNVEYSTSSGPYYNTYTINVKFCIPEFSSSNIISNCFQVDNNEGKSGVGYYMIIVCDLMVQLGLLVDFKRQVLQWDGDNFPIKNPLVYKGKHI